MRRTLLICLLSSLVGFATPGYAAENLSLPKTVKVGPKGKEKVMTTSELRRSNPEVYSLYERTTQAALDYKARGPGVVPLSCVINPNYIACSHGEWLCYAIWGLGAGLVANCVSIPSTNCDISPCD